MSPTSSTHTLQPLPLPTGLTSSYLTTPSLKVHYISTDSSPSSPPKPLILLIHGFPEIAFSWRKIMLPLSSPSTSAPQGYHVVAFDQRGYGRTTGWEDDVLPGAFEFEAPKSEGEGEDRDEGGNATADAAAGEKKGSEWTFKTLVEDTVGVVRALGYQEVECVIGHDFGAVTARLCAKFRPDVFKSVITLSHPLSFTPPQPPHPSPQSLSAALAALGRKHYKFYYSTPPAATDMLPPTSTASSLKPFLKGYFHLKSANWTGNAHPKPYALEAFSAEEMAKMPGYYIMPLGSDMRETVAKDMVTVDSSEVFIGREAPQNVVDGNREDGGEGDEKIWMSGAELDVYVSEWNRTGFQGGLSWYRVGTNANIAAAAASSSSSSRAKLPQPSPFPSSVSQPNPPSLFIAGAADWGMYQEPGVLESMVKEGEEANKRDRESGRKEGWRGVEVVGGAGHWVQQERSGEVIRIVREFLGALE